MTALTETIVAAVDHDPTNPEFELLHPRGRDGKWIKKGGHIKIHPKMGGEPLLGIVDDVASDGTINITLNDGRKVNAKPDQIEQIHSVARLDAPAPPAGPDQATPEASNKAPDAVPPFNDPLPSSDTERGKDEIYPQLMADLDAYDAERPGNRHKGEDRRSVWNRMWGNGYVRNKLRTHYLNEAPPAPKAAPFDPFSPIPNANHEQVEARHPGVDAPIYVDAEMKDLLEALWQFDGTMDTHQSDGGNENRPAMIQFRTVEGAEKFLELIGHDQDVVDLPKIFNPYIGSDDLDVTPEQWDEIVKDKRYVIDKAVANGAIVNVPVDDLADVTAKLKAHLTAPEPAASYPDPWGDPDAPFDRNSDPIHENAVVTVDVREDAGGTRGAFKETVTGRVAQINAMGSGHPPVIEIDPLDGSPRVRGYPEQIEHVDGVAPIKGYQPGEYPKQNIQFGVPQELAGSSWEDVLNDRIPGFSTRANQASGVNASYWVVDHSTGGEYLVKNTFEDEMMQLSPEEMNANEVFVPHFLNAMNFEGVSPTVQGASPSIVIIQHAGDANGTSDIRSFGEFMDNARPDAEWSDMEPDEILSVLSLKNPDDIVRMTVADSLLGNSDRHEANWMIGTLPDGTRLVHPIDHSLLSPETYGGIGYWGEFNHNASTRLTRHLREVMGDERFRQIVAEVLDAREAMRGADFNPFPPDQEGDAVWTRDQEIDDILAQMDATEGW